MAETTMRAAYEAELATINGRIAEIDGRIERDRADRRKAVARRDAIGRLLGQYDRTMARIDGLDGQEETAE